MTQSVHYTRVMDFYSTSCLQNYCVDQTWWYVLNVLKAAKECHALFSCVVTRHCSVVATRHYSVVATWTRPIKSRAEPRMV